MIQISLQTIEKEYLDTQRQIAQHEALEKSLQDRLNAERERVRSAKRFSPGLLDQDARDQLPTVQSALGGLRKSLSSLEEQHKESSEIYITNAEKIAKSETAKLSDSIRNFTTTLEQNSNNEPVNKKESSNMNILLLIGAVILGAMIL